MRTAFEQRCDGAWRENPSLDLRLSIYVLRRQREFVDGPVTNVYVVHDPTSDLIKIGFAQSPRSRVSTLATGNPNPLELIVSVPAPVGLEKLLHGYLADDRVRGEWFRPSLNALTVVELLLAARDFQDELVNEGAPEDPDVTVEVLCSRANELLDMAIAVAA